MLDMGEWGEFFVEGEVRPVRGGAGEEGAMFDGLL
jgi:hypothetical protein